MAYGSGPVPPADAIVGPGNKFVTAAEVFNCWKGFFLIFFLISSCLTCIARFRIDMLAGPSECLVLADDSADPSLVAADLLAQVAFFLLYSKKITDLL